MLRIGLLAYSTDTGLGHQTLEFFRHMNPDKTLVADISNYNHISTHHERYPDARICKGFPRPDDIDWLTDGVDVIFTCETPLNHLLYQTAKEKGVSTVQQYNYEFLDYFRQPNLPKPTVLAAPTKWNMDIVTAKGWAPVDYWPVPVNRDLIPFRQINHCETFIHIIGRPAVHDRNGTIPFLEAAKQLGNRLKYRIFLQPPDDPRAIQYFEPVRAAIDRAREHVNIEVITNTPDYADIYKAGDVLVLPRKYGGLCLPTQEALAAGMPVIMTNISPNNDRLPYHWLVNANKSGTFFAHTEIDIYEPDVADLVRVMNSFSDDSFMRAQNQLADHLAEWLSWDSMKGLYLTKLTNLTLRNNAN